MLETMPRACIFVPEFLKITEADGKVTIAVSEDCPIPRMRGQTYGTDRGVDPWIWAHQAVDAMKAAMTAEDPDWEFAPFVTELVDVRLPFYTIYEVERHWGGREEGGWYYDTFRRRETIAMLPTDGPEVVEAMVRALWNRHEAEKYGDIGSVLGGVDLRIYAEEVPGEHEMTERPRYE